MAVGLLHPDETGRTQADVRLIVTTAVLRAGRGPLTLDVDLDGLVVMPGVLVWIVTTNKGWAHLRGIASTADGGGRLPFRADLYCADSVGDPGPDRMALRLYAAGVDPNVASPSHKIQGWMDHGSIRIGPRSASDPRPTPGALDRPG